MLVLITGFVLAMPLMAQEKSLPDPKAPEGQLSSTTPKPLSVQLILQELPIVEQEVDVEVQKLIDTLSRDGGATSGGGVENGISAARVVQKVAEAIQALGQEHYPAAKLSELAKIASSVRIFMVKGKIAVPVQGTSQPSDAFSVATNGQYFIFLNSIMWDAQTDPLEFEPLIHHEIMVLLGLEKTGEYHYTLEFEKNRQEFWRTVQTENNLCSIQLFEKRTAPYDKSPGASLGASSASITWPGATGGWGLIKELPKRQALYWRGVIDSNGHFRMQVEQGPLIRNTNMVEFSKGTIVEPMRVYSDPYSAQLKTTTTVKGEKYWIFVNCNLF